MTFLLIWSGDLKFQIAFDFRFTFSHSCLCFYNNAIQQLTLTLPPSPPPSPPGPSPGPVLPMHFFKAPSRWAANRGSMLKIVACCATKRRPPLQQWCVVQPPPPLCCAVSAAAAKRWRMVASGDGHGVAAQLKFEVCTCGDGDADDVQECWLQ